MNETDDSMLAVFTIRSLADLRKVKKFALISGLSLDLAEPPPAEATPMVVTRGEGTPPVKEKKLHRTYSIAIALFKDRGALKRIDLVRAIAATSKDTAKSEGTRVAALIKNGYLALAEEARK